MGESARAKIEAREFWNPTGVHLQAGETYEMLAYGQWIDFFIKHGPAGDPSGSAYMSLFEARRRVPGAAWFALVGALDQKATTCFVIGQHCIHKANLSGELTCFANDVPGFYWNNRGHVFLEVKRMA